MWHSLRVIPKRSRSHAYPWLRLQQRAFHNSSNAACARCLAFFVSASPGMPSGRPSGWAPWIPLQAGHSEQPQNFRGLPFGYLNLLVVRSAIRLLHSGHSGPSSAPTFFTSFWFGLELTVDKEFLPADRAGQLRKQFLIALADWLGKRHATTCVPHSIGNEIAPCHIRISPNPGPANQLG